MLTFPQRDIDLDLTGGVHDAPTQLVISPSEIAENSESYFGANSSVPSKKPERKRKPWVYKSEYDKLKKERDAARKAFMISIGIIAGLVLTQIFGRQIIDLILSV